MSETTAPVSLLTNKWAAFFQYNKIFDIRQKKQALKKQDSKKNNTRQNEYIQDNLISCFVIEMDVTCDFFLIFTTNC